VLAASIAEPSEATAEEAPNMSDVTPFKIAIPDAEVADLKARL
jgi:hypothetical protein